MKELSDFIFSDSWVLQELDLIRGEYYMALKSIDLVRKGMAVRFEGFDDVNNHFGILVFTHQGTIMEIKGDFCNPEGSTIQEIKMGLKKLSETDHE